MLYLLDANVLISAHCTYYPLGRVPEFWDWLLQMGIDHRLKMPIEMIEEICCGTDELAKWLSKQSHRDALQLADEADVTLVGHVMSFGYAANLTDQEIETMGRDPFLIA